MNKSLKIMLVAIAVLLSVFVILSFLVKSYLTDERVRTLVSENAERALDREVRLGDIKIGLFRGIVVRDIEVMEKDSEQTFVTAKDFILRYQILPLLRKKLIIDELSINDSELYLHKRADGSFNFSDIPGSDETADKAGEKKGSGLPVSMDIDKVSIRNARIKYTDAEGKLKEADIFLNAELAIEGISGNILSSAGELKIRVAEAWLKDSQQPLREISSALRYKADADRVSGKINLHSLDGDFMSVPFNMQGIIGSIEDPALSVELRMPDIDPALLGNITSHYLPEGMTADGKLTLMLKISKKAAESTPGFNGEITMAGLSFNYRGLRPVFDGSITLTPELINLRNIRLRAGQNSAELTGSAKNYMTFPDIRVALKSSNLSLDELFVPPTQKGKPETTPGKPGAQKEPEPMNLNLRMTASLDIGKTVFRGMQVSNLRSSFELKENKLRITNLTGNTLSGSFAVSSTIDLTRRGMGYQMDLNLNGVKLEEVVNAFAPKANDKLFGTLAVKAAISGAGTVPDTVKQNLKGKGNFSVRNGVIRNAELGEGLLAFLGLQELREIPIQKAEGNFSIGEKIVELTTLISSKDLILNQKGTIGMDEKLDLDVLAKVSDRLSPKLLTQSGISRFISEEKGWTSIPLKVGGTLTKPSYAINTKAVGKKAGETIQKRIEEELFKSLQRDKEKPSDTDQRKRSAPEDLIRDLFR